MALFDPYDLNVMLQPGGGRRGRGVSSDWEGTAPVAPGVAAPVAPGIYSRQPGHATGIYAPQNAVGNPRSIYGGGGPGIDLMSGGQQIDFGASAPAPPRPVMELAQQRLRGGNPAVTDTAPTAPRGARPAPAAGAPTLSGGDKDENGNLMSFPNSQDAQADPFADYYSAQQAMGAVPSATGATAGNYLADYNDRQDAMRKWQMGTGGTGLDLAEAGETAKYGQGIGAGMKIPGKSVVNNLSRAIGGAGEGYFAGEAKKERDKVRQTIKQLRDDYEKDIAGIKDKGKGGKKGETTSDYMEKNWGVSPELEDFSDYFTP